MIISSQKFQIIKEKFVGNCNSKVARSFDYSGWRSASQPSCTNFSQNLKEIRGLALFWLNTSPSGGFSSTATSKNSIYLNSNSESSRWDRNTQCSSDPTRYTTFPSSGADQILERLTVVNISFFSRTIFAAYCSLQSIFIVLNVFLTCSFC